MSLGIHLSLCHCFAIPIYDNNEWAIHDGAIRDLLGPLHYEIGADEISPANAAQRLSDTLVSYFSEHEEFIEDKRSETFISHIPKTLAKARKRKNI